MLEIVEHKVQSIIWDAHSGYRDGIVYLEKGDFQKEVQKNLSGTYELDFLPAYPGESKRIIHITDIIKPAYKTDSETYPGWEKKGNYCGEGVRHQTSDLCITQSFQYPGIQEGIIDMEGEGAKYSVFSEKIHLVMVTRLLDENTSKQDVAHDLIQMMLNASVYIGRLLSQGTGSSKVYEELAEENELPYVGYAYFIQAQGPLRNVHLFGENCMKMKPRLVQPEQVMDGAVVSGNYIISCQKNPTYFHQDNPVIHELYERTGKDFNFGGVIFSTESSSLDEKRENAKMIAEIAKKHGFQGIIITQEGGGHADVDLMQTCEACEKAGISTVILANELGGPLGNLPSLVSFSDKADAIVSTGNNDELIQLKKVNEVIGTPKTLNQTLEANGELNISLGMMYTATCQLGANKMRTQLY